MATRVSRRRRNDRAGVDIEEGRKKVSDGVSSGKIPRFGLKDLPIIAPHLVPASQGNSKRTKYIKSTKLAKAKKFKVLGTCTTVRRTGSGTLNLSSHVETKRNS